MKQRCIVALAALSLARCVDTTSYTELTAPTHDCGAAPNVAIKSAGGDFTLTGTCEKIWVAGSGNTIRIEATAGISLTGNHNTVTIRSVDSISVRGGSDNVVSNETGLRRTAPNISVLGGNNNNLGHGATRAGGTTLGGGIVVAPKDRAEPKS
jgi:hypothetical protein